MTVRYSGPKNRQSYNCAHGSADYAEPLCQSVSGLVVDDLVAREILTALEPVALEASLAAVAEVERERAELSRHWQLRRERAGYEVERAARQYQAVEPANRMVARELERRWEESLKAQRHLEEEYERWLRTAPGRFSTADEEVIRSLAVDLPRVWHAGTTTPAERQRAARLLLERVTVTVDKTSERVEMESPLDRRPDAAPHAVAPGEAVRSPIRLPALGGAAAGAVRPGEKRGGDRRAVERGGLPTAEASGSVHGPDGAAADLSP